MLLKKDPKTCPHLNIRKEIFLGMKTGDYICYDCGETFAEKPTKSTKNELGN